MNKSIKILINYLLGPLLFLLLAWIMYHQLKKQQDLGQSWQYIVSALGRPMLWSVFLLMFLNWGLESLKWKYLMSHLEPMGFFKSFKSVLAGAGVTMLTPNRTGEFAGRILFVQEGHRIRAVSLTILGNIAQLSITLFMGLIGWWSLRMVPKFTAGWNASFVLAADYFMTPVALILLVILSMFFLKINALVTWFEKIPFLKKRVKYLDVLHSFSRKQLLRILSLSFFRYLIFTLQYALMLKLFVPELHWVLTGLVVMVFYLIMAVVPSVGWSEIPLRAAMSVEILSFCTSNMLGIQVAALGIWLINLLLPAFLGAIFIAGNKFFTAND